MNYPLISEYVEAIKAAEDNFEELSYLRPVMDENGLPVMTSGNFAVVFKMKDERDEKYYAVKCFTKEQEGREEAYHQITEELKNVSSPYLTSVRYLDKELFVDTDQTNETEFPVLLMDWVEGLTLDKYLRANLDDKFALEMLAYRFSQLAQWLIPQPFAHGDLKPDNILVREDGTLVLVDYDGMYVPAMKGQKARELGSPDFRHPQRTENDFDDHIDDFPIISILLSLKALSIDSSFLARFEINDKLLFSEKDYKEINRCSKINALFSLGSKDIRRLLRIFMLCISSTNTDYSFVLSNFFNHRDNNKTKLIEDDYLNCYSRDFDHSIYNEHKEKLLRVKNFATIWYGEDYSQDELSYWYSEYDVEPTTKVISDQCFRNTPGDLCEIAHIRLPNTTEYIGDRAFEGSTICYIELPASLIEISENAFSKCNLLDTIIIPPGHFYQFALMLPNDVGKLKEVDTKKIKQDIKMLLSEIQEVLGCSYYDILNYLFGENEGLSNLLAFNSFYFRNYNNISVELDYSSKKWNEVKWDKREMQIITYSYSHHLYIHNLYNIEEIADAIFYVTIDMGGLYLFENRLLFDLLRNFMISESVEAAIQGKMQAQNFLGECYMKGNGVSQDYAAAIRLFAKAAKNGNPKAQYNLGYCYENGIGLISNRDEARCWYEKAAESGHSGAKQALERFSSEDLLF